MKPGGWGEPGRLPVRKYRRRRWNPTTPTPQARKRGAVIRMNVTIDARLADHLRALAASEGPNMSAIVEDAIRAELQRREIIP